MVLCTEVLEHVEEPEGLLSQLVRVCQPGGTLIVTVPDGEVDDYEGHLNFWNEFEFAEFVSSAGDVVVRRTTEGDLVAIITTQR